MRGVEAEVVLCSTRVNGLVRAEDGRTNTMDGGPNGPMFSKRGPVASQRRKMV